MSRAPVTRNALVEQSRGIAPASSDATSIEQARAIAQVKGALIVAQDAPRDEMRAATRMREACALKALAEQAFYRYSRGDGQVTGESIHLATELARCWGNLDYGISELRRDTVRGESEMLAYAWDLETNARVTNTFIVPHMRDRKGGPVALVDMRDIYESNANHGARRLRECIFRVLPRAFIEEAKELCTRTLQDGGGVPLAKRREDLLEAFAALGISRQRIERKVGQPADRLSALDIGTLGVVYRSLKRGETTAEEEFPEIAGEKVADELRGRIAGPDQTKGGDQDKAASAAATAGPVTDQGRATAGAKPRADTGAKEPKAASAPSPAAAEVSDEPDLSAYVVPMPRRREDKTPHFLLWRDEMKVRLDLCDTLEDVDRVRMANADWIETLKGADDKSHHQAVVRRFEEARQRIAASSATAD